MNLHSFHPQICPLPASVAGMGQQDVNGLFESILGYRVMPSGQAQHALVAIECSDTEAHELLTEICTDDAVLNETPSLCYLVRTESAELMGSVTHRIRAQHRKAARSLSTGEMLSYESPQQLIEKSRLYLHEGRMTAKQLLDDIEVERPLSSSGRAVCKLLLVDDAGAVLKGAQRDDLSVTAFVQKLQAVVSQHNMLAILLCRPDTLCRLSPVGSTTLYSYGEDGSVQSFKAAILCPDNIVRHR